MAWVTAEITVLDTKEGGFLLIDSHGIIGTATRRLEVWQTIRASRQVELLGRPVVTEITDQVVK